MVILAKLFKLTMGWNIVVAVKQRCNYHHTPQLLASGMLKVSLLVRVKGFSDRFIVLSGGRVCT